MDNVFSTTISFILNGKKVTVNNPKPKDLLVDYLRSPYVNLTGTKLSCGEGGCGVCTVIWSKVDPDTRQIEHTSINACLRPVCSLDGTAITTIEGLPSQPIGQQIEKKMVENCGSQCGYCSPGFVMTMFSLLQQNQCPDQQQVENQFSGNLCRCTGYISILNAMQSTAQTNVGLASSYLNEQQFTEPRRLTIEADNTRWITPATIDDVLDVLKKYQPVQGRVKLIQGNTSIGIYKEDIYNPTIFVDLSRLAGWKQISLQDAGIRLKGGVTIAQLSSCLATLLQSNANKQEYSGFQALYDHIQLISGVQVRGVATVAGSLMLVKNYEHSARPFSGDLFTVLLTLGAIVTYFTPDDGQRESTLDTLPTLDQIPAGMLITDIFIPVNAPDEYIKTYKVARRWQNAHAIVNAGFACQLDQNHQVQSLRLVYGGISTIAISLTSVVSQVLSNPPVTWDVTFLNTILPLLTDEVTAKLAKMDASGISADYKVSLATNLFYKFYLFVCDNIGSGIAQSEKSALLTYPHTTATGKHEYIIAPYYDSSTNNLMTFAAPEAFDRPSLLQRVSQVTDRIVPTDVAVQRTSAILQHVSPVKIDAPSQVNGQAKYTHDLEPTANTLNGYFVYSERRNACFSYGPGLETVLEELRNQYPGATYIHHGHIPNPDPKADIFNPATIANYDPIFAADTVTCYGQPIGLVVADDLSYAKEAAAFIQSQIIYLPGVEPSAASFDEAISKQSLLKNPNAPYPGITQIYRPVSCTNPDKDAIMTWLNTPHSLANENSVFVTASQQTGPQYHFYMEPQGAYAIPREDNQIEIYASTQNHASCQKRIAFALNQPLANVKVGLTRLGGGFGGKELRQVYVAAAAAVAAKALNKPVRVLLDRKVDMQMVGGRHPFDGTCYMVSDTAGLISRMRIDYSSDAGHSFDCSAPVMDLALLCAENAYNIPVFKTVGTVYRTNTQSRTAFRSFGLVQAMLITESAIERLAFELGKLPEEVRKLNFYPDDQIDKEPPLTPYGAPLPYCRINQVWDDFSRKITFDERREAVATFNAENRWRKRGISMVPLKYGISYTFRAANQGSAYVIVYKEDGSVMLHHGGVEMGQGLHTKMAQIAANELGIDIAKIRIGGTNTAIIPNVSSTGASTGSDLNGGAVINACKILKRNLIDFCTSAQADYKRPLAKRKYPDLSDNQIESLKKGIDDLGGNWKTVISLAATARQDLSAQYSYASPELGSVVATGDNFQIDTSGNQVFYYYNYCVAASEVEIDVLTGQFEIIRSDIVYDAGDSLNDNIDYGQIEGGFMQGVGCLTTEELLYADDDGHVITDGTWEYKIPCTKTIPREFNVYLLKYESSGIRTDPRKDTYGINSSKSTGEPPLVLANTVFFAIRHAITEARKNQGLNDWFKLSAPATVEKIQLACSAKIVSGQSLNN